MSERPPISRDPVHPPAPTTTPRRRTLHRIAAVVVVGLILGFVALTQLHPFLTVTRRIPASVLVIEGWIPDYAVEEAMQEFQNGRYERIYTTGGPLELGSHLSTHRDFAHLSRATLIRLGLPPEKVVAVPTSQQFRNRTFASAVALRDHFRLEAIPVPAINVVTEGAHARRTRLCFHRALGRESVVGIISIENRDYDSNRWWRFSAGIKTILGESLAVFYAWLAIDYGG